MTWTINPSLTKIEFLVKHMMVSSLRGSFSSVQFDLHLDTNAWSSSHVQVSIDPKSVSTNDRTRDDFLRSSQFFAPELYGHIVFSSTRVALTGKTLTLSGNLKIRDQEHRVEFKGSIQGPTSRGRDHAKTLHISLRSEIERSLFGLNFGSTLDAGGVLVGKRVNIHVEVELNEKNEPPQ